MSSIGDALLLDIDICSLRIFSFENKVNENEFSWVSYSSLIFLHFYCLWTNQQYGIVFAMSEK